MSELNREAARARYVDFLQKLSPQSLAQLKDYVVDDIEFMDPFHKVQGIEAMQDIFANMFKQLLNPGFVILDAASAPAADFLKWRMHFAFQHAPQKILYVEGITELHYAADGRVSKHFDYWDAAHQFYTHIPLLGMLMRLLRRAVAGRHA